MKLNKRPLVLNVEDDGDSCEVMEIILGMAGIDVRFADGIQSAMAMPYKQRFDIFLLDLWLNDGDGSDLCITLRSQFPDIPVVFYTGCADKRDRHLGLTSGAAEYLVKPYLELVAPAILRLSTGNGRDRRTGDGSVSGWRDTVGVTIAA